MERLAPDPAFDEGSKPKDSPGGLQDRDSGFSSAEYDLDHELHSPGTDGGSSEASIEARLRPVALKGGKRPNGDDDREEGAAKRRKRKKDDSDDPYRPWGGAPPVDDQPLSLVLRTEDDSRSHHRPQDVVRIAGGSGKRMQHSAGCSSTSLAGSSHSQQDSHQQQRNYKNMTRERRIEANARERTRVHTISAAFDTLRRCVPAYSHSQKLSKLSVLRIACAYILTLSRVAGDDYSADRSQPSLADCVDNVSKTIQMEGKLRKKKDE